MSRLMYSCEQASKLSSRAMEEPLGRLQRIQLSLHLMLCRHCKNFSRQIEFLRRSSRKLPEAIEKDLD
ncbi:MAG: zf-HC2 domain-containing protein [Burkholderiales bacterium]